MKTINISELRSEEARLSALVQTLSKYKHFGRNKRLGAMKALSLVQLELTKRGL
jgi:hypothetical protein